MSGTLRVPSWDQYQHYKDRCPPWIKLATDTFQNYKFSRLHDASKLLAICIYTLASRSKRGEVPNDFGYIKNQGCLGSFVKEEHLKELIEQGLVEVASDPLAECKQSACLEERRGETEESREREEERIAVRSEDRPSPPPVPPEPAILEFGCTGEPKRWSLTEGQIAIWRGLFPAVDVLGECRNALAWALANPTKRKTAAGMLPFLTRWLTKAQNSGGAKSSNNGVHTSVAPYHRPMPPIGEGVPRPRS